MASKRPAKKGETPGSPLDARRNALAEQERKLQEEIARRQRLIEEAPKIAKDQEKRRREELVARASRTEARFGTRAALQDPRYGYEAQIATAGRGRRLKREQRRGMFTFFVLLLTFAGVVAWLYFSFLRGL
jgi:hypothetical protein